VTPDDDDEREPAPEHKCPNCGAELHASQDLCQQCGYMRPTVSSAGASGGAAAIGCGAGLVASAVSVSAILGSMNTNAPAPVLYIIGTLLAVVCFIAFRAIIARNVHARAALVAFIIVFVVFYGGFLACVASVSNLRFQ
jgi:hypothetical protein